MIKATVTTRFNTEGMMFKISPEDIETLCNQLNEDDNKIYVELGKDSLNYSKANSDKVIGNIVKGSAKVIDSQIVYDIELENNPQYINASTNKLLKNPAVCFMAASVDEKTSYVKLDEKTKPITKVVLY